MMLKIVPFLVWYRAFSPRAGRERVPDPGRPLLAVRRRYARTRSSPAASGCWPRRRARRRCGGHPRGGGAVLALGALAFALVLARILGIPLFEVPEAPGPRSSSMTRGTYDVGREQVTEALREVFDPELGLSVVDLGLIYGVEIDAGRVQHRP